MNRYLKQPVALTLIATLLIVGIISWSNVAVAWGPERETYTNENPAPQAVFNSITNNAAVGDERDFVRIVEVRNDGEKNTYVNELTVQAGHDYEIAIYYHNNASSTFNAAEYGFKGIATDVRVSAAFPESLKAGETGQVDAIISAGRCLVPKIWGEAYITADEDVTLAYISGSAKIFNDGEACGRVLSTNLFSSEGTFIGYNDLDGFIPGCDEYSGHIIFRVRVLKAETSDEELTTLNDNPDETKMDQSGD